MAGTDPAEHVVSGLAAVGAIEVARVGRAGVGGHIGQLAGLRGRGSADLYPYLAAFHSGRLRAGNAGDRIAESYNVPKTLAGVHFAYRSRRRGAHRGADGARHIEAERGGFRGIDRSTGLHLSRKEADCIFQNRAVCILLLTGALRGGLGRIVRGEGVSIGRTCGGDSRQVGSPQAQRSHVGGGIGDEGAHLRKKVGIGLWKKIGHAEPTS